jgi:hypothetical protein
MPHSYTPRRASPEERDLIDGIRMLLGKNPLYERASPGQTGPSFLEHPYPLPHAARLNPR